MAILTHMPEFKILSKKVKGFKYIPADSLDLHSMSF
jgi:peptide/nickel transport system substrate-binding protein